MRVFKNGALCGIDKINCAIKDCINCNLAQLTREEIKDMIKRAGSNKSEVHETL